MRAVDTNVIVRFLTDDDPEQSVKARQLIAAGDIFIAMTVILETEWVLRSSYGLSHPAIVRLIETFVGLPGISVEDPARLNTALGWAAAGMDFADALHLAQPANCEAFVSFDRKLAIIANERSTVPVIEP